MNIDYIKYGETVRQIRKTCGYSQKEVSYQTHISIETLRRLENGIGEPKIDTLVRLSDCYKFDLLLLLEKSRSTTSFFSEEFVNMVSTELQLLNFDKLKDNISEAINSLISQLKDSENQENCEFYIEFLKACNAIDMTKTKDLELQIINIENLLILFSRKRKNMITDPFLYTLEEVVAIFLAIQYRRANLNTKAIALINSILSKYDQYPTLSTRQIRNLGLLYLNLSYSYHHLDEHDRVVQTVNEALVDKRLFFTNITYNNLMLRKATALFNLKNDDYYHILTTVFMNEDETRKQQLCNIMFDVYGIKHHMCQIDL